MVKLLGQITPVMALAVLAVRQRLIVSKFRDAGVTAPDHARTLADLRIREGALTRRLRRHGVIVETEAGTVYLDELAYQHRRALRLRLVAVVALAITIVAVILMLVQR